jgi:hypothetical protein
MIFPMVHPITQHTTVLSRPAPVTFFALQVPAAFRQLRILLSLLVVAVLSTSPALAKKSATGSLGGTVTLHNSAYRYPVFLPESWSSKQKWPISLFLHRAGERGSDGGYTEYPGVAHNSWDNAYGDPELVTWMLSKSL